VVLERGAAQLFTGLIGIHGHCYLLKMQWAVTWNAK